MSVKCRFGIHDYENRRTTPKKSILPMADPVTFVYRECGRCGKQQMLSLFNSWFDWDERGLH